MAKGCGTDQEIKVRDRPSGTPQPASFAAEQPSRFGIQTDEAYDTKELIDTLLAFGGVAGVVDTLIEFRERDDRQAESLSLKVVEPSGDFWMAGDVVDHPIGVDEIPGVMADAPAACR